MLEPELKLTAWCQSRGMCIHDDDGVLCWDDVVMSIAHGTACPAELCFAFFAFHEWASTVLLYADVASWTRFGDEYLFEI